MDDEYDPIAERVSELARDVPGYVSHKRYVADDGERVTIVKFESAEALDRWRVDPEHCGAKKRRLDTFLSEFRYQICNVIRERTWEAETTSDAAD